MSKIVSPDAVYSEMRRQKMTPFQARVFLAIAARETGGTFDMESHNGNWRTGDDSYGLYQYNYFGILATRALRVPKECHLDLTCTTKAAIDLYKWAGNSWRDWYVYTDADAQKLPYWNQAGQVMQRVENSGAFPPEGSGQLGGGQVTGNPGINLPGGGTLEIPGVSGLPSVSDITDLLKEVLLVGIIGAIGLFCVLVGIWGIANDTTGGQAGETVKDLGRKAWNAAKIAAVA